MPNCLSKTDPTASFLVICFLISLNLHPAILSGKQAGAGFIPGRAADAVRLDGIPGSTFRVLCHGKLLETMDRAQAYREAHKGAIMLHQGETYVVNEMDHETHTIRATETDVDYYTLQQPLKNVDLSIINTLETRLIQNAWCAFGDVEVKEQYTGDKIKRKDTIIGLEPLDLPPITFRTKAFWLVHSPCNLNNLSSDRISISPEDCTARKGARDYCPCAPARHVRPVGHRGTLVSLYTVTMANP